MNLRILTVCTCLAGLHSAGLQTIPLLRSIIENLLLDTMFEVPDKKDVTEVIVDRDTVENNSQPTYKKSKAKKKKSKASEEESKTVLKEADTADDEKEAS